MVRPLGGPSAANWFNYMHGSTCYTSALEERQKQVISPSSLPVDKEWETKAELLCFQVEVLAPFPDYWSQPACESVSDTLRHASFPERSSSPPMERGYVHTVSPYTVEKRHTIKETNLAPVL